MQFLDSVIIVFAKAPVVGKVKTRLIAQIGADKATQLHHDLVHRRLESLLKSKLCTIVLYCAPDVTDNFFKDCAQRYSIELKNQSGIDLGEKMANAIAEQSGEFKHVIVVGTDAPALETEQIKLAIQALQQKHDVVIVPAEDGGYVLIGMRHPHKAIFLTVPWGSNRVTIKTRANCVAAGLKLFELDTCWDIDRPEDYYRWLRISEGR